MKLRRAGSAVCAFGSGFLLDSSCMVSIRWDR
jgi:hypothetical protein